MLSEKRLVLVLAAVTLVLLSTGCESKGACEIPAQRNINPLCWEDSSQSTCEAKSGDKRFIAGKTCASLGYKSCGDEHHMLQKWCPSACVGKLSGGATPGPGLPSTFCNEEQTHYDCTKPVSGVDYTFEDGKSCGNLGFTKPCPASAYPSGSRFKASQDCAVLPAKK